MWDGKVFVRELLPIYTPASGTIAPLKVSCITAVDCHNWTSVLVQESKLKHALTSLQNKVFDHPVKCRVFVAKPFLPRCCSPKKVISQQGCHGNLVAKRNSNELWQLSVI
jgi:hypothetical protein